MLISNRLVAPKINPVPPKRCIKNKYSTATERIRHPEVIRSNPLLSSGFIAPHDNMIDHPAINMPEIYIANW